SPGVRSRDLRGAVPDILTPAESRARPVSAPERAVAGGCGLAGGGPAGRGLPDGPDPGRRGPGEWPPGRAIDPSGTIRPGPGTDAATSAGLRAVPLRAAELRGDRLSTGIDTPAGGATEPICPVVPDRRRPRVEADARVRP